jgi:RimJ/RimL family protein N-acetyltransferase
MELRDGSLVLGPWRKDDAAAVYAACQDPEIQRWVPVIPRPYTFDDARAYVAGDNGFVIRERGHVAGAIRLRVIAAETGRIGYWCVRHERRRGIATRALRRVCRYALDELGLLRLELITDVDNVASQGVAQRSAFSVRASYARTSGIPTATAATPSCSRCLQESCAERGEIVWPGADATRPLLSSPCPPTSSPPLASCSTRLAATRPTTAAPIG